MGFVAPDLADYLTTGGITTTKFGALMPPTPDDAIQIIETGGMPPVHAFSSVAGAAVEERPHVQIVRRSMVYARARAEMNVIWRMLDGAGDMTINGTRYKWIESLQSPFSIGRDETQRELIACNFRVCKALTTSTST
mgnify:FL=1